MKLALILWMASWLPQPVADPLCLSTTVYLEARDQSELGQRAVAEVALRRQESGRWGDSVCEVVTARKQFAPTIVSPNKRINNLEAWNRSLAISYDVMRNFESPNRATRMVVPGADSFHAHDIVQPRWATSEREVRVIDGHTFSKVMKR